jgi:hypothetical protein
MPASLRQPEGLPTAADEEDQTAWSEMVQAQLSTTRKTAENWRVGLFTMFGLITTLTVIKGPSDIEGLNAPVAVTAGILLLLALASAVYGSYVSLQAAYGKPERITRDQLRELGGMTGYQFTRAEIARSKLRQAQTAIIVTLALVAAAIGIVWYGPRQGPVTVIVAESSGTQVCGKLMSSGAGYIVIGTDNQSFRIRLTDVTSISAGSC